VLSVTEDIHEKMVNVVCLGSCQHFSCI